MQEPKDEVLEASPYSEEGQLSKQGIEEKLSQMQQLIDK
jgi:hypothetical protein